MLQINNNSNIIYNKKAMQIAMTISVFSHLAYAIINYRGVLYALKSSLNGK